MAQPVFVALPEHDTDPLLFAVPAPGGDWLVTRSPPQGAGRGQTVLAFAPATLVTTRRLTLPTRNALEARRAAGFQLEDELGEALETLHIAVGPLAGPLDTPREVSVVAGASLQSWLARLADAGLPDAAVLPETALLGPGDGVVDFGARVAARMGGSGFGVDAAMASDVLAALQAQSADLAVHGERLAAALGRPAAGNGPVSASREDALVWMAQQAQLLRRETTWVARHDMREGAFARRGGRAEGTGLPLLSPLALGLLAACGGLMVAQPMLQAGALTRQAEVVRQSAVSLARDTLGELAGGDPVGTLLAEAGSSATGASPGVRVMAAAVYEALSTVEGARLRALRWDGAASRLTVTLTVPAFADTDTLSAGLRASGLTVRMGDARQEAEGVTGDFVLEAIP